MTYHHQIPVQLRFSDIDQLGHVNNNVCFSLFDLAKARYFTDLFGNEFFSASAAGSTEEDVMRRGYSRMAIVVVNINANFFTPVYFTEDIVIETSVVHLGTKSFTLQQRAVNNATGEVKAECRTVMVGFNVDTHESVVLPEMFVQKVRAFEEVQS